MDACAEVDEKLLHKYLEDLDISVDEIRAAIRTAVLGNVFVPILTGAAFKNKGVQPLLDAIAWYLPSPVDLPPVVGFRPGEEATIRDRKPPAAEPFSAIAFKIMSAPYVGKLTY